MLTFVRFFTPGRIRLILMLARISRRRRLILRIITSTWRGWQFYKQARQELNALRGDND